MVIPRHKIQALSLLFLACTFIGANCSATSLDGLTCSQLSEYIVNSQKVQFQDPSRKPTKSEAALIDKAKIDLLKQTDYGMGTTIVDIDNDGKEDLLAWNIGGSGRFVSGGVYEFSSQNTEIADGLTLKFSIDLGVLHDPRFIRVNDTNYFIDTATGDSADFEVSQITRSVAGQYQRQTDCRMGTVLQTETKCRHPACRKLVSTITSEKENGLFVNVEWPHKYFPPVGLAVFFSENASHGDFDNTGQPTSIWRIGRSGYLYQHVYWGLLGQGEEAPDVASEERPKSEDGFNRRVLAGDQHARLRRTLDQQSEVLSSQLHRHISLPNQGEFFLFDAYNRTYWAWDFEEQPYGEEIHITYTNAKKSDYIGAVKIKRNSVLKLCESNCLISLDRWLINDDTQPHIQEGHAKTCLLI